MVLPKYVVDKNNKTLAKTPQTSLVGKQGDLACFLL